MNLINIQLKIIKNDPKKYSFFFVSIILSLALFGALGLILYSPTVTNVLMATGSTYTISKALYFITLFVIFVFLFYANSIYLKYKSKEIGLFLSLGLPKKKLEYMVIFEYFALFFVASLIGLILAIPIAYFAWSSLTYFLANSETVLQIGWQGLIIALFLAAISFTILLAFNIKMLRSQNIITMLKFEKEVEIIKGNNFGYIIVGLVFIFIGCLLFILSEFYLLFGGRYSILYLVISFIGLYMFTAQITQIGNIYRYINIEKYNKNFLFFNLLKQKGKQYTLSLFVSTSLVCVAFFSMCFNIVGVGSIYFDVEQQPYDIAVLTLAVDGNIEYIQDRARNYNIDMQDFSVMDFIIVGAKKTFHVDGSIFWNYEYITKQTSFEDATGIKLDVTKGTATPISIIEMNVWEKGFMEFTKLYISGSGEEISFKTNDVIRMNSILNTGSAGGVTNFVVLNDEDFNALYYEVDSIFRLHSLFFNASNIDSDNLNLFLNDVIDLNLQATNGMMIRNYMAMHGHEDWEQPVGDENAVPYKGNELYAMRQWHLYPFARETAVASAFESGAIYLLLVTFISLIAFIISAMIVGLKISQTLWQDNKNYIIAKRLGMGMQQLKQLINKQIAFIFFYPMIVGTLISGIAGYQMFKLLDLMPVEILLLLITSIGIILTMIQLIVFIIFRNNMIKKAELYVE